MAMTRTSISKNATFDSLRHSFARKWGKSPHHSATPWPQKYQNNPNLHSSFSFSNDNRKKSAIMAP